MTRKRIATLAVAAGAALALAGVVQAGHGGGTAQGSGVHLTVHNVFGLQTLELKQFQFKAQGNPDGSATGSYTYKEVDDGAPFDASGPITCMAIVGNDAWIGGTITSSTDPTVVGMGSWWHVTDNGQGANDSADITTFLGIGTAEETQAFCDDYPPYKHPFGIDGGNIKVRGD
ncbi:MAG TPA: hypothetical protein VLJ76_04100 [Gaiellaceae bacterium]|nr:hypothetical protein [Gaiellaceae bacterium]